jgi:hypothetical protein
MQSFSFTSGQIDQLQRNLHEAETKAQEAKETESKLHDSYRTQIMKLQGAAHNFAGQLNLLATFIF